MNRRSFLAALGSTILMLEPERVRAYSFLPGEAPRKIELSDGAVSGDFQYITHSGKRALTVTGNGRALLSVPSGTRLLAEFRWQWQSGGWVLTGVCNEVDRRAVCLLGRRRC